MGRGDIRSRKGKIAAGSYGNARPHKVAAPAIVAKVKTTKVKAAAEGAEGEKVVKAKKAPAKKKADTAE